jgi:hypothetical protein
VNQVNHDPSCPQHPDLINYDRLNDLYLVVATLNARVAALEAELRDARYPYQTLDRRIDTESINHVERYHND